MKLAIVHDWLNQKGGAEDVLETLMAMYAKSPLYTSIFWEEEMPITWREWDMHKLWTDRLPLIHQKHQAFLPFYPLAWGSLDLSQYDVILSNKSGFCHGLQADDSTLHICYCLAPTRYVWQYNEYMARENVPMFIRSAVRPFIQSLKGWDYRAAQRVDKFIASTLR